ncbi:hypothetical protein BGW80DRAFT_1248939 [Lactifluus volemus]|nr:hypothetical protein BGW80DRAFT_1248939 [Lactifluus volemus]
MRRTSAEDETHRGDDRPTLPHIRDLFGKELSQPLHPNAPNAPVPYSPSSHFSQLSLPDEAAAAAVYRGDPGRGSYTSTHGHTQASGPACSIRSHATPSASNRSGYNPDSYGYNNPEPSRIEEAGRAVVYPHDLASGTVQYSYPPPPPPPHQGYTSGPIARVPPTGYPYARSMAPSYSGSGAVVPSGLVAPEQPSSTSAKYECSYCGKVLPALAASRSTFTAIQANVHSSARLRVATSGNEVRESEGEEESEEGSPQPQTPPPR